MRESITETQRYFRSVLYGHARCEEFNIIGPLHRKDVRPQRLGEAIDVFCSEGQR
jgi:hypothetical protein